MSVFLVLRVSSNSLTFLFKISLSLSNLSISHSLWKPSSWSFNASCSRIFARASFGFFLGFGSS